jgi:hypothetical protein
MTQEESRAEGYENSEKHKNPFQEQQFGCCAFPSSFGKDTHRLQQSLEPLLHLDRRFAYVF